MAGRPHELDTQAVKATQETQAPAYNLAAAPVAVATRNGTMRWRSSLRAFIEKSPSTPPPGAGEVRLPTPALKKKCLENYFALR